MKNLNESLKKILNISETDDLEKEVINQISSIDKEKIRSVIKQIVNLKESPLIFIRMNSEFNEGEEVSGRLICMDEEFHPLKSKAIIKTNGNVAFEGNTDEFGSLEFAFKAEQKPYEVNVIADGKEKTIRLELTNKEEEYICYTITDRDYYMPGQRVYIRFILWKMVNSSYKPSQEPLKVTLVDPQRNKVLIRNVSCDPDYGIGKLQIPIAEEAIQGEYKIQVSVKDFKSEKTIHIKHYKPPDIELNVECEPQYLKIGEETKLQIKSKYFYGSPVKGGQVKIEVISKDGKSIVQTCGETNDKGEYEYKFKVPKIKTGEFTIKISATDLLKREASKDLKISLLEKALIVSADMTKNIESGQQAEIRLKTEIPSLEGETIPLSDCQILASINDTELKHHAKFKMGKTDKEGICVIPFEIDYPTKKKKNFDINILVESEKLKESKSIRKGLTIQKAEPKEKGEEKQPPKIWLNTRIDSSSLNIGDILKLKISAERKDVPVYIDVEKENVIYRTSKNMVEGKCEFQISINKNMWGNLKIISYAFRANGILEKNEQIVYINPKKKELLVNVETDKINYSPRDKTRFKVKVLQKDKVKACCLGAMLVDAAVLELGRKIETPLDIFFKKEFIKNKCLELQSWTINNSRLYFDRLIEALFRYICLNSKAIGAVIELLAIINKNNLLNFSDFNSAREKIINQIRETAEKRKRKNKKTLIFNILQYISESVLPLRDIEMTFQAAKSEIDLISEKDIDIYQKVIADIQNAREKEYITIEQEELLLIKVHEAVLNIVYDKSSSLTLLLREELNKMLDYTVKEKKLIEQLRGKLDLKFKPLKKATPKDLKIPKGKSICLELGSDLTLAGFAGEDAPRSIIPTLIGYPKYTSIMTDVEHYNREYYIGEEAKLLGAGNVAHKIGTDFKENYLSALSSADFNRRMGLIYTKTSSSSGPGVVHRCFSGFPDATGKKKGISAGNIKSLSKESVRFFFPETSLWIPKLESNGVSLIETELPDQITTHELTVFASTKDCEAGMGTHRISVKQKLFIKMDIPPVLTHGDIIQLGVILTNLNNDDLLCKININSDEQFFKIESEKNEILVPAKGMNRIDFRTQALKPGECNLWIEAKTPQYVDVVRKKIKINPKGEAHVFRQTGLILGDNILKISPSVPQKALFYKANLSLVPGYQMGSIDGLDSIVAYPHGCTEQTMSKFLPNIMIYRFLKEKDKLSDKFREKVEEMTVIGIQRLISLRHSDGGWGWWEKDQSDPFLTAYILYGLAYTVNSGFFVDSNLINKAIEVLEKVSESQDEWKSQNRSQEFCTIYVMRALLEAKKAGFSINQEKLDKALTFIQLKVKSSSDIINDPNLIAHMIEVLIEYGFDTNNNELQFLINRLNKLSHSEEHYIYWQKGSALAGNVESTSNAAMALYMAGEDPVTIQKALNYIMAHRASGGGWSTTSDTVAAIKCLSNCAIGEKADYKIKAICNNKLLDEFSVNNDTLETIVYDMRNIPLKNLETDNILTLEKKGEGLLVYDLTVKAWYPKEYLLKPEKLTITRDFSSKKVDQNNSITVKLNVRTSQKLGMFIIEEPIPAGFIIFEPSLEKLQEEQKIASYKLIKNKLNLYIDELENSITLTYQLIGTIKGKVIAKETVAYPMYNVALRANSTINVLEIN